MPDAPPKKPFVRRRRARLSLKGKQALKAAREALKLKRQQERAEREALKVADAKAAIEALIAKDVEIRRMDAAQRRPPQVIELCDILEVPRDTLYHPRYNVIGVPPETDDQTVEAICFGACWPADYGGLGGYGHLRKFIEMTFPWVEWNPWMERTMRVIADDDYAQQIGETKLKFINLTGPGSASKTFSAGVFACSWFMVDFFRKGEPRTSITLTSTSKGIISQRVWPIIQRCFHESWRLDPHTGQSAKFHWAHMVDSQKTVMAIRPDGTKDAKHSIIAMAVETGELTKAVDKIKGRHTERMMLIVDEANSTPQAIFDCIPNMLTSVRELIVLVIGNAMSRLDPHGLCCEPSRGWKSITIDEEEWDSKGVAKWGIGPGVCLHFDGAKSPNVIAGRTEYKHIYSFERWQQVLRMGEEYRNTLQHWSQDRGFWPPDGLQTTIFTEAMVVAHDGMGAFSWMSTRKPIAALDPAFGGDACVLTRGDLGDIPGRGRGLQILSHQVVPFDPDSPDAVDFQIAQYVIAKCKEWGVEPDGFGLDATGIGRGVAAFVNQLWSPRILAVEFGGKASDLSASLVDPRPGFEVYANRVTELWYSAREILLSDQLKGLYQEAIVEFCSRTYEFANRRYKVENKPDMKQRIGYSPDHADAIVILCEVARRNGLVPVGTGAVNGVSRRDKDWSSVERDLTQLTESAYNESSHFGQYAEMDA